MIALTREQKEHAGKVGEALKKYPKFHPVLLEQSQPPFIFDFTKANPDVVKLDFNNPEAFTNYVFGTLKEKGLSWGAGGYGEDRLMYPFALFNAGEERRSIHLAQDLWVSAGTAVYAPLPGKVHSFNDNNTPGDYGPTIILEHELEGLKFYTLYGHLSRTSLPSLSIGQEVSPGQQIATIGKAHENVGYAPHIHFQIITDMLGKSGDFPGVAKLSEKDYYLTLSPDPNLILRVSGL
jgi:murein DD-endopeptidase MepM/ murein hydrolase activator NlpD